MTRSRSPIALGWLVAIAFACSHVETAPPSASAASILAARRDGRRPPRVTVMQPALDTEAAYAIQREVVAAVAAADPIAGFKAAVTSAAARARLDAASPIFGVLFASGRSRPVIDLTAAGLHAPIVEVEVGFHLRGPVSVPVETVEALRALVDRAVIVIEVPDVGFVPPDGVRAEDVIAANAGSARFVVGEEIAAVCGDLNALAVTLTVDGEEAGRGRGADALGDFQGDS